MPIDPNIPLQTVNVGQQIAQGLAQGAQMRAARQQEQLQHYGVLQAKQDFEDQQNLKAAWRQAGGDPDLTMQLAAKTGVSQKAMTQFATQQIALKTQVANLRKTNVEADAKQFENSQAQVNRLYEIASPQLDALKDPAKFPQAQAKVMQQIKDERLLPPDQYAATANLPQQEFIDKIYHLRSLKAASTESGIAKDTAQAGEAAQKTTNLKAELSGITSDNSTKADLAALANRKNVSLKLQDAWNSGGPQIADKAHAVDKAIQSLPVDQRPAWDGKALIAAESASSGNGAYEIQKFGMDPKEQATADKERQGLALDAKRVGLEAQRVQIARETEKSSQIMAAATLAMHQQGMADGEVAKLSAPFMKIATNGQTQLGNINQAITQLSAKDGATQFMGLLSTLKADVAGGGVRLNNSEYEGVMHARLGGKYAETWQRLTSGKALSEDQVTALKLAMSDLRGIVVGKIDDAANAMQDISTAPNQAVRQGKALWYVRNKFGMDGSASGAQAQPAAAPAAAPGAPGRNRGNF